MARLPPEVGVRSRAMDESRRSTWRIWLLPLSVLAGAALTVFVFTFWIDAHGDFQALHRLFHPNPDSAREAIGNTAEVVSAVLGIAITLALGVFERTREIGLLRAVGMNRRQLRRSVRWEAVIVSTFGAFVGIVLGTFLGVVASLAVPDDVISKLAFNPAIIVVVLVFAILAGLFAALYPSFKASNMDVLEAIATE